LGYIADALNLIRSKQYESAAKALMDHVNDSDVGPSSRISIMEWIAECYTKTDNRAEAARWSETAARSAMDCEELSDYERRRIVLRQLEQAMELYYRENDTQAFKRVSALKHSVR
jgi:hypothetical protein